jgi:hypothetical protein
VQEFGAVDARVQGKYSDAGFGRTPGRYSRQEEPSVTSTAKSHIELVRAGQGRAGQGRAGASAADLGRERRHWLPTVLRDYDRSRCSGVTLMDLRRFCWTRLLDGAKKQG